MVEISTWGTIGSVAGSKVRTVLEEERAKREQQCARRIEER
jgi:hypothetical protein